MKKIDKGLIKKIATNTVFHLILIVFAFMVLFPVFWGVSTSLRTFEGIYQVSTDMDAASGNIFHKSVQLFKSLFPPAPIQWHNYVEAWHTGHFSKYFGNSLFYMITVVAFMLFFSSLGAYAFARLKFPGKEFIFYLFLASLVMPLPTIFITIYILLQNFPIYLILIFLILSSLLIFSLGSYRRLFWLALGILIVAGGSYAVMAARSPDGPKKLLDLLLTNINLLNTRTGYILPQIASGLPYTIFLMRSFFEEIPVDLEDAARIDGCSRLGIYFKIILPLSRPILAVTGIFGALSVWKEFLFAVVVFSDNSKMPIQTGLLAFQGTYKTQWNFLMAGVIITVIPVIIVYVLLQKHIISGLTAGAVKG